MLTIHINVLCKIINKVTDATEVLTFFQIPLTAYDLKIIYMELKVK